MRSKRVGHAHQGGARLAKRGPRAALVLAVASAAALTVNCADGASATPTKEADVTGAWRFETQTYGPNCRLSGTMTIKPDAGGYSCAFLAKEHCQDVTVQAKETCAAKRDGAALTIQAQVKAVAPLVGYEPDNFELKIESGAYMKGMLHSFHSAPVDFFRGDPPVS